MKIWDLFGGGEGDQGIFKPTMMVKKFLRPMFLGAAKILVVVLRVRKFFRPAKEGGT